MYLDSIRTLFYNFINAFQFLMTPVIDRALFINKEIPEFFQCLTKKLMNFEIG